MPSGVSTIIASISCFFIFLRAFSFQLCKLLFFVIYFSLSVYLLYRGISISATVLPRHIAEYHKYMKPIRIVDKSNFLLCPMPGKLIRVLVKENDIVDEGQPLCVVEAMKMENTLIASKKCMVNKINHEEGATLSVDQIIMEFIFK